MVICLIKIIQSVIIYSIVCQFAHHRNYVHFVFTLFNGRVCMYNLKAASRR